MSCGVDDRNIECCPVDGVSFCLLGMIREWVCSNVLQLGGTLHGCSDDSLGLGLVDRESLRRVGSQIICRSAWRGLRPCQRRNGRSVEKIAESHDSDSKMTD